jgi:hypothetical protein
MLGSGACPQQLGEVNSPFAFAVAVSREAVTIE